MTCYIEFNVHQHRQNIGGHDPEDSWSRDSYDGWVDIDEATLVDKDGYDVLGSDHEFKVGDVCFLVWAQYSTGDSFGRDGGQYELLEVHSDANVAMERVKHYEELNDYSVPWVGYFESLDFVKVEMLRVQ